MLEFQPHQEIAEQAFGDHVRFVSRLIGNAFAVTVGAAPDNLLSKIPRIPPRQARVFEGSLTSLGSVKGLTKQSEETT